jgi:Fe-S cluster assembly iron-binding protein IscA
MLQLTTDATNHLRAASARRVDGDRTPRFARQSGQIKLGFASSPEPGDAVVEAAGMQLFVAKDIANTLEAAVVDVQERDGKRVLVLRRQGGRGQEDA